MYQKKKTNYFTKIKLEGSTPDCRKLQVTLFVFYYSETFQFVQFYRSREIDCQTDSIIIALLAESAFYITILNHRAQFRTKWGNFVNDKC